MQILVVEDESKIANLIRRGLMEEHYAVDIAKDGQVAIDNFDYNTYDLIILDRMLPKLDGIEVCKYIRQKNTNVPILMLTAKSEIDDRIVGLDSGADDYLTKPFAFGELNARIRALLRRGSTATPAVLEIDDLLLDPAKHKVTRAGNEIVLTAREYSLLEYLIRNKGLQLTKTQIINHVWDYSYDGYSNIVETYIRYLRKKIQVNEDSKTLIHTVRGFGYIMEVRSDV